MPAVTATPLPTSAIQPRIAGLVPARVVAGLPTHVDGARAALRLEPAQLTRSDDGAWLAELGCPAGTWRVWPERGVAAWIGHRSGAMPRVDAGITPGPLDLIEAVRRLHARGLWCLELRILTNDGWSANERAATGLRRLLDLGDEALGISALWSRGEDGAARVEIYRDGSAWASDWLDAERWLLTATGVADV